MTWKRRPRLEKEGLLPGRDRVSGWRVGRPSLMAPGILGGRPCAGLGSSGGHRGGRESPRQVSKVLPLLAGGGEPGASSQPLLTHPRVLRGCGVGPPSPVGSSAGAHSLLQAESPGGCPGTLSRPQWARFLLRIPQTFRPCFSPPVPNVQSLQDLTPPCCDWGSDTAPGLL